MPFWKEADNKYFKKIVKRIICVLLLSVVIISLVLLFSAGIIMMRTQHDQDLTLIKQTTLNVEALDKSAYNLLKSLYLNVDGEMIKYARDIDIFSTTVHTMRLNRIIRSETLGIENVAIYNGRLDKFYSMLGSLFKYDPAFSEFVSSTLCAPRRKPLFRFDHKGLPVLTYSVIE